MNAYRTPADGRDGAPLLGRSVTGPRARMLVLQPRRPDLTRNQFSEHWRTVHADHARKITALQRYVQSHRSSDTDVFFPRQATAASPYDGISEAWFTDPEAMAGMTSSAEYRNGALADEPNFLDIPRKVRLLCTERHLPDGSAPDGAELWKVVVTVVDGSSAAWGELLTSSKLAGVARRTLNEVHRMLAPEGAAPIDFVLELAWRSQEQVRAAIESPWMSELLQAVAENSPSSSALIVHELRFL